MKNFYFAYIAESDGKMYASWNSFRENENLLAVLERHQGRFVPKTGKYSALMAVNLCPTKMQAEQLAAFWNQSFKQNGTHIDNQTE